MKVWRLSPLALLALCHCAARAALPVLQLTPASLGVPLQVDQQLTFDYGSQHPALQAALEVDAHSVRLAALSMGQTVVRLEWDGHTLEETHAAWVPGFVSAAHILSDLQLVLWPADAIRAALPPRCSLLEAPGWRLLRCDGNMAITVAYEGTPPAMQRATLRNLRYAYGLTVETAP